MRGIYKSFPGVKALQNVDFNLCKGEIHALMGENGAGKSTLIKVLTGVYGKDQGEIFLEGIEAPPLLPDLRSKLTRWLGSHLIGRAELCEIEVVVQDLARIVEYGFIGAFHDIFRETLGEEFNPLLDGETLGGEFHDLFQRHLLKRRALDSGVEVVDVGLQVLSMMKAYGLFADHRLQSISCVGFIMPIQNCILFLLPIIIILARILWRTRRLMLFQIISN